MVAYRDLGFAARVDGAGLQRVAARSRPTRAQSPPDLCTGSWRHPSFSTRAANCDPHPRPLPTSPMNHADPLAPLSIFGLPSLFPTFWQSNLHPSLSFSFEPLSVPLINPAHLRLWRETFNELSFCLARVQVTRTQTSEHPAWIENLELLIIQAWRTNVEGDLLGFLFGSVRPGRRQLIAQELIAPIVQLADDLSPDIYSQSDDSPAPYVLERSLDPYLQWTACLEEPRDEDTLPSRQEYLKPYDIIPHAFYPKAEEVVIDDDEENNDEETLEEGSYSEYSEGELSEEEAEEEEETGSEWEALPEEAARTGMEAKDPEAAQRREEIATGIRQWSQLAHR
ncbi:hypothetical protein CBR_g72639 [Chara braunii]|uniref:Uncharacterized protein n=1 Tax=Chara braunii TaxID=69332 RepID=A0A388K9X7_CHABU|nr:hypothetical protein CBR_g72639 [Chara braunii]|eukprot:GBG66884.1 hypothetical protein CBR_g72639 [Chara braunii]